MIKRKLEDIRAKLFYCVINGHDFIAVSRLMVLINKITRILGHNFPKEYEHLESRDSRKRKVYDTLDDVYNELYDLLVGRKREVIEKIGEKSWEILYSLLPEVKNARNSSYSSETGNLGKRGRKFNADPLQLHISQLE